MGNGVVTGWLQIANVAVVCCRSGASGSSAVKLRTSGQPAGPSGEPEEESKGGGVGATKEGQSGTTQDTR